MKEAGQAVVTPGVATGLTFAGWHAVLARTMSNKAVAAQRAVGRKEAATVPAQDSWRKGYRAQIARTNVLDAPAQPIGVIAALGQDRFLKGAVGERAAAVRKTPCACRHARKSCRSHHWPAGAVTAVVAHFSGGRDQGIEVVQG